jgi:uncharacterized cupin superfamily protein
MKLGQSKTGERMGLMDAVNLYATEWDGERDLEGFGLRFASVGARLGGELLGATLWELRPGQRTLFHCHHGNEELLVVLSGSPVVRTGDGECVLRRGDMMIFPRGRRGSHAVRNPSDEPACYLFVSTMFEPDVLELPESGKIGIFAGAPPRMGSDAPLELFVRTDAGVDYYDGETGED